MSSRFGISSLEEDFAALGLLTESAGSGDETGPIGEGFNKRRKRRDKKGHAVGGVEVLHKQDVQTRKKNLIKSRKGPAKMKRRLAYKKRMRSSAERRRQRTMRREGLDIRDLKNSLLSFLKEARQFMRGDHPSTVSEAVKPFARARTKYGVASKLAEEIEELTRLTSEMAAYEMKDVIHAFARLALIAEMVSGRFETIATDLAEHALDDEALATAEVLSKLAEDAAHIAKGLNESSADGFDFAALTDAFRSQMRLLLQGLDIYADLTEGDEEEESEEEEEETEEEGEDEDDEEEEEEAEEEEGEE